MPMVEGKPVTEVTKKTEALEVSKAPNKKLNTYASTPLSVQTIERKHMNKKRN